MLHEAADSKQVSYKDLQDERQNMANASCGEATMVRLSGPFCSERTPNKVMPTQRPSPSRSTRFEIGGIGDHNPPNDGDDPMMDDGYHDACARGTLCELEHLEVLIDLRENERVLLESF